MGEIAFNLSWLIPIPPLLAFALIVLATNANKRLSAMIAVAGVAVSWVLGWWVFLASVVTPELGKHPFRLAYDWLPAGSTMLTMGVTVDPLTAAMLFMVPFVCLMIFIYSVGYMGIGRVEDPAGRRGVPAAPGHVDPLASRFFAYISLFACGMLGLVVAENLLMLFIFWEIMGLCSYLLIGFWFARSYPDPRRITPKQAGVKAFLTTRIGDAIMFAGMALLYAQSGSLAFADLFTPANLERLATTTVDLPLVGSIPWATLLAVLIFWGAIGKSAQFPLHVWLPDAMEGPTPVSALIHAATMVSAGVYLVLRMFPLMQAVEHGPALSFIAFIGAFTALFAASIALAQNDIKRVLAYSTISQLGYMFAALGIGAYVAAAFHLLTHAFFKALLFLGSGSVIHGVEHGHHAAHHGETAGHGGQAHEIVHHGTHSPQVFDANDMRYMGGLFHKMPVTALTFIAGGLALSGFPLVTAGFWSKDEILADAWVHGHQMVFWTLALAALLTAFYTGRQIFLVFFGPPRTEAARHAHESDRTMTFPLVVLAAFAIAGGWVGIPESFPGLGELLGNPFHHFIGSLAKALHIKAVPPPFDPVPISVSVLVALGGLALAWVVYGVRPITTPEEPDPLERLLGRFYVVLRNKYYFDELYAATVVRFARWLADVLFRIDQQWVIDPLVNLVGRWGRGLAQGLRYLFDEPIVDGLVNAVGHVSNALGAFLRLIQTGRVQNYLVVMLIVVLVLLAVYTMPGF
ncbi:MAG: NADH-quinone oxidoreductase subunit L [Anaerolineae bacterium]|nr:NADH-quinone oxidoreductase subunit L [Anaerolineae bacterium]MDW8099472.1 NADH-quinone oxidoreductase subunit L [Anaerolineae bacterium]